MLHMPEIVVFERLTKAEVNALPLFSYKKEITFVQTKQDFADAVAYLNMQTVLGFDTETRPSFHKGKIYLPSLLQLAGADRVILFHFGWHPFSSPIKAILENPSIIKAGVALRDDLIALQKLSAFTPRAVCEISTFAKEQGVEEQGLRGLSAKYLGLRISKGERCSNWANKNLNLKQMRYAATDAWVSRELYLSMLNKT